MRGTASRQGLLSVPRKPYWPGLDEGDLIEYSNDGRDTGYLKRNGRPYRRSEATSCNNGSNHRMDTVGTEFEFDDAHDDDDATASGASGMAGSMGRRTGRNDQTHQDRGMAVVAEKGANSEMSAPDATSDHCRSRKRQSSSTEEIQQHRQDHVKQLKPAPPSVDAGAPALVTKPHDGSVSTKAPSRAGHGDPDKESSVSVGGQNDQGPALKRPAHASTKKSHGGAVDRGPVNSPSDAERKPFRTRKRSRTSKMDKETKRPVDERPEPIALDRQEVPEPVVVTRIHIPGSSRDVRKFKKQRRRKGVTHDEEAGGVGSVDSSPFTVDDQDTSVNLNRDWITSWAQTDETEVQETSSVIDGVTKLAAGGSHGPRHIGDLTTKERRTVQSVSLPISTRTSADPEPRPTVEKTTTVTPGHDTKAAAKREVPTKKTKPGISSGSPTSEIPTVLLVSGQETTNTASNGTTTTAAKTTPATDSSNFSAALEELLQTHWPALNDAMSIMHDTLLGMVSPAFHSMIRERSREKKSSKSGNVYGSSHQHDEEKSHQEHVERLTQLCEGQQGSLEFVAKLKSSISEVTTKQSKEQEALKELSRHLEKARERNSALRTRLDEKCRMNESLLSGLKDGEAKPTRFSLNARREEQLQERIRKDHSLAAKNKLLDRLREENSRLKNQVERLQSSDTEVAHQSLKPRF